MERRTFFGAVTRFLVSTVAVYFFLLTPLFLKHGSTVGRAAPPPSILSSKIETTEPTIPPSTLEPTKKTTPVPPSPTPTLVPTHAPTVVPTLAPTSAPVLSNSTDPTIALINEKRAQMGLSSLSANAQLAAAAAAHSADLAAHGGCGHTGSDGSDFQTRATRAGFSSSYGETVACGVSGPAQAVDMWWASPGHFAILTKGDIKHIGVGWAGGFATAVVGF